MKKVGITGTIASGKSLVGSLLTGQGYAVFDADACAKQLLEKNSTGYQQVIAAFGNAIVNDDQTINRKQLASIAFTDKKKRMRLNQITHPLIIASMQCFFKQHQKEALVFAEVPLLYQIHLEKEFDAVIFVPCQKETAMQRMMKERGYSQEEACLRLQAQQSNEDLTKKTPFVLYNDSSKNDLAGQLETILKNLKE